MRRTLFLLPSLIILMLANFVLAEVAPDQSLDYVLNSGRSTWLIRSGSGVAKVMEYRQDDVYGPGYVVKISYDINVLLRGRQTGDMGIFVPERVFDRQKFLADLEMNHPMSLGSFNMDYEGKGDARDSQGNMYRQCVKTRAYDINPMYRPTSAGSQNVVIMWFNQVGSIPSISNLQIKMKVAETVPVLGAVQLDISGVSDQGLSFDIGMDMVPN